MVRALDKGRGAASLLVCSRRLHALRRVRGGYRALTDAQSDAQSHPQHPHWLVRAVSSGTVTRYWSPWPGYPSIHASGVGGAVYSAHAALGGGPIQADRRTPTYPVSYEADYADEGRNRLTTFFRLIVAIPWLIVSFIYSIGSLFVTIAAWFALLFTARYPEALRNYNTGFLRYHVRLISWIGLQTDEWPPFGFGEYPDYPVRVSVAAPGRQSRLKVFLRLILGLPALFMSAVIGLIQGGAATATWFSIVFRGYQPRGAHDAFTYAFSYQTRVFAYYGYVNAYFPIGGLLVDDYPPLGDEAVGAGSSSPPPMAPPPPPPPV